MAFGSLKLADRDLIEVDIELILAIGIQGITGITSVTGLLEDVLALRSVLHVLLTELGNGLGQGRALR